MQNDILKEYAARGNYIFPPRPSMRLTTDLFAYCAERLPHWNTISISGYHIREAGSTAVQELAFTIANGIAYCEAAVAAGLSPDAFGERLSFFFNAHNDFFQEVAKFRAARRLWARVIARAVRRHEPEGARAPLPRADRRLDADGAAAGEQHRPGRDPGALGGPAAVPSRCTRTRSTRRSRCPRERAATIALRTQQVLAHEVGVVDTADPLGGSYFIEALTDELEARALELIGRIDELGGAVAAIEAGFVQGEIEAAAYAWTSAVESGERTIVGVNAFTEDERPSGSSCTGSTPARASARSSARARVRAERDRGRRPSSARRRARDGPRAAATCCRRCAPRSPLAARSARSARCCARSGASTTGGAPARDRDRPDLAEPGSDAPPQARRRGTARARRHRPR